MQAQHCGSGGWRGRILVILAAAGPARVSVQGAWSASAFAAGYSGTNYLHDQNAGKGAKSVTFRPALVAKGVYAVAVWYPAQPINAANVPVDIVSADGTNTAVVNQQVNGGRWNVVGTNRFNAGTNGYVTIRTAGTTNYVVADAVRFSWVDTGGGGAAKSGAAPAAQEPAAGAASAGSAASAWASGAWSDQFGASNLLDGDTNTVWIGDPGGSPWRVIVDLGQTKSLSEVDVMFLDQPWTNMGMIGSCDADVWVDFGAVTNWPVAARYIYLNLWDPSGASAPPAIRELLWLEE
jgi:hypothetical protein